MTFEQCLLHCAGNQELVEQFERLSGHRRLKSLTSIERAIDDACGYDCEHEYAIAFASFVWEFVWCTLVAADSG